MLLPVPLSAYGTASDEVLCAWAVRCRHVPDLATCRRLLDPKNSDVRFVTDEIAAGRLTYDPAQAAKCLAEAEEALCPGLPFGGPSCARVFGGRVEEGDACAADAECRNAAPCQDRVCGPSCCVGVCGPPPPPEPPPAGIGEACRTHADCVLGAYCELDGRCVALPDAPGERCLFGCAWGDLYCDLDTETCGAYAAAGAPCGGDVLCDPAWSFCDGACRPRPGLGEPCDDTVRRCIASSFCDGGLCAARRPAGEPCDADGQCLDACDDAAGACVAYAACVIPSRVPSADPSASARPRPSRRRGP